MRQVKVAVRFTGSHGRVVKTLIQEVPVEVSKPLTAARSITMDWLSLVVDPEIDIEVIDVYLAE